TDPAIAHINSATPSVISSIGVPVRIDRRPTARSRDFTAPWPTNGPTPGSTAATPTAAQSSRDGYTPTITTAATQHSRVNHPPAVYLTSQVSTTRHRNGARTTISASRKFAGVGFRPHYDRDRVESCTRSTIRPRPPSGH